MQRLLTRSIITSWPTFKLLLAFICMLACFFVVVFFLFVCLFCFMLRFCCFTVDFQNREASLASEYDDLYKLNHLIF